MAWDDLDITALDQDIVDAAQETLMQYAETAVPTQDVRRGANRSLLISPLATLLAAQNTLAQKLVDSQSLLKVATDTELYDEDLFDTLLSNYRITRTAATAATGTLLVLFDSLAPVTIRTDTVFYTADGTEFTVTENVRGRTTAAAVVATTDQLLTARVDGLYSLLVPVAASEAGTAGNITQDTELSTDASISNLALVYANADFTGGVAADTNTELLTKLQTGLSTRTFSNRASLLGFLQDTYSDVTAVSVIGMGDEEMDRDQRLLLPVATGGKTDIYLRSSAYPESYTAILPATLLAEGSPSASPEPTESPTESPSPVYSTWELDISRDTAPGFYSISAIKPENAVPDTLSYAITDIEYGIDLSVDFYIPDIVTVLEGAFTPFQTATVQFLDDDTDTTDLSPGDTQYYAVTFLRMPLVDDVQQYLTGRSVRPPATDILVKAAIPNLISVEIEANVPTGSTINTATIKTAIVNFINSKAFGAELTANEISGVVIALLPTGSSITTALLSSRLIYPDRTEDTLIDVEEVPITDAPELYSTARTIALMARTADVDLTINYVEAGE